MSLSPVVSIRTSMMRILLTLAKQTMNVVFPGLVMSLRLLFGFLMRNVTMSTMSMISCMERSSWMKAMESTN